MRTIKVYHGSYCQIDTPSLTHVRADADFGTGFYVSTDYAMAEKWAYKRKCPVINEYTLNFDGLEKYSFGLDSEWLDFVLQNRNAMPTRFSTKAYDLIIGTTVDDRLSAIIEQYESGFISEETVVEVLNSIDVGMQICLRTEKSLGNLRFDRCIELTQDRVQEVCNNNKTDRKLNNQIILEIIQKHNKNH